MLGFFNTTEVDEYADWIIAEVKRTLPAGFDPSLKNVGEKVDRLDKRIAQKTDSLVQTTKLNLYKKARLASRVREGMTAHGYPAPFIKTFSMDLIRRIQTASRK